MPSASDIERHMALADPLLVMPPPLDNKRGRPRTKRIKGAAERGAAAKRQKTNAAASKAPQGAAADTAQRVTRSKTRVTGS